MKKYLHISMALLMMNQMINQASATVGTLESQDVSKTTIRLSNDFDVSSDFGLDLISKALNKSAWFRVFELRSESAQTTKENTDSYSVYSKTRTYYLEPSNPKVHEPAMLRLVQEKKACKNLDSSCKKEIKVILEGPFGTDNELGPVGLGAKSKTLEASGINVSFEITPNSSTPSNYKSVMVVKLEMKSRQYMGYLNRLLGYQLISSVPKESEIHSAFSLQMQNIFSE